jgi:hypothetical protein
MLDGDKKDRCKILKDNFPSYKFFAIPANDIIKNKKLANSKESLSLLERKKNTYKVRDEYKGGVKKIVKEVNKFL